MQAAAKAYLQAIAVRFKPGDEKQVNLIALVGSCHIYGLGGVNQRQFIIEQGNNPLRC